MTINIVKYIANSGFASRRKAEALVRDGQVMINNNLAEIGELVDAGKDQIMVRGIIIEPKKQDIYILLNKPTGFVCTNRKFKNEKSVFDLLPTEMKTLFVVGRLDKNSRGLVLLTNDGGLGYRLSHPKFEHEKKYKLQIANNTLINNTEICKRLVAGIDIGDGDGLARAKDVEYLGNGKFRIVLTEGKKRQIRRMFKKLGCEVVDLQRVQIDNIKLEVLAEGKWRRLTNMEIADLINRI